MIKNVRELMQDLMPLVWLSDMEAMLDGSDPHMRENSFIGAKVSDLKAVAIVLENIIKDIQAAVKEQE